MSEPSILLCGPALNAEESAASLDLLRQVSLPGAAKYLVTTGKFDAEGAAKAVNVDADYPRETAHLQSLLRWAGIGDLSDPRFRDGYDLYCLRRVLARFKGSDYAVLLRNGAAAFEERWPKLEESVRGRVYLIFGRSSGTRSVNPGKNLLIDLNDERAAAVLDAAWELYATGAVYGMEDYSFDFALSSALEAVELEETWRKAEIAAPLAEIEPMTEAELSPRQMS